MGRIASSRVPGFGLKCEDLPVLPVWVSCVGFLKVLRFPPTVYKHAGRRIGYTKLPTCVIHCVDVCVHNSL